MSGKRPATPRPEDHARHTDAVDVADDSPHPGASETARAETAGVRIRDAARRDDAARVRDGEASARDRATQARDREAEEREASAPSAGPSPAAAEESAASHRARSATHRARAAADRREAAKDRIRAADDRRQSRLDLQRAYRDDLTGVNTGNLIARLRRDANARGGDLAALRLRLESAEHELEDLRAIRDALTPSELPERPGLGLAAAFVPAAERVGGDFYLVAEGPRDTTVLVVGDVVGHGLEAARRASFVRTAFIAIAPFSDDPARLLGLVNTALVERAGTSSDFVTAACITYLPAEQRLRWAYAGHPPALWLDSGKELHAPRQGLPLGIDTELDCVEGAHRISTSEGVMLYTDGLTEARREGALLGLDAVSAALERLERPSAGEAVEALSALVTEFANGALRDDLCLLAARIA